MMNVNTIMLVLVAMLSTFIIGPANATLSTQDLKAFNKQKGHILEASKLTGVNPNLITAIANKESSLGINKVNHSSGARGVMQYKAPTWRASLKDAKLVLNTNIKSDVMNDRSNILVGAADIVKHRKMLRKATGKTPTDGDLYMAHLLGVTGAINVLNGKADAPISRYVTLYKGNRGLTHSKGKVVTVSQFRKRLSALVVKQSAKYTVALNQARLDAVMDGLAKNQNVTYLVSNG